VTGSHFCLIIYSRQTVGISHLRKHYLVDTLLEILEGLWDLNVLE